MKEFSNVNSDQLFKETNSKNTSGELALWQAVVMQNLEDLKLPPSNKKYRSWSKRAIKWFNDADADFYYVCDLANIAPQHVLQQAHHLILMRKSLYSTTLPK